MMNEKIAKNKQILMEIFAKLYENSQWNVQINMFYYKGHFKITLEEYKQISESIDLILEENETNLENYEKIVASSKLMKVLKHAFFVPDLNEYVFDDVITYTKSEQEAISLIINEFLKKL